MKKIVFLLEESSAKEVLFSLIPKILRDEIPIEYISHEGKSDLKKSIPRKLKAWKEPHVTFVVLIDKDSSDCIELKREICGLIPDDKKSGTLVRIICTELESWFLGDLKAVEVAFSIDLSKKKNKTIFQNPDNLNNAKEVLKKLVPEYQQILGSRRISSHMDIEKNRSKSFQIFVSGIRKIAQEN